jgi:hypothetical protein
MASKAQGSSVSQLTTCQAVPTRLAAWVWEGQP